MSNAIVQYILLRSDLLKELGWSIGALVAQACHASTAVIHLYRDDENTQKYLSDLDNMHKVVLEIAELKFFNGFICRIPVLKKLVYCKWKSNFDNATVNLNNTKIVLMAEYLLEPVGTAFTCKHLPTPHRQRVPNEESLKKIAEKLKENSVDHKLWIEQPENIPTCLALKPYPKEEVKKYVGKFKLYKATLLN